MSEFDDIMKQSGTTPSECSCETCQKFCKTPCLGTPSDMLEIIKAGYSDKVDAVGWAAGILMGVTPHVIPIIAPKINTETGYCIFFKDGLCELHDKGLKPTEGKLTTHVTKIYNDPRNALPYLVAKTWVTLPMAITDNEMDFMINELKKSNGLKNRK